MYGARLRKQLLPLIGAVAAFVFANDSWTHGAGHRVDGFNELVVYAPGTHERGIPGVELTPGVDGVDVDVPPIVHVHRFYYDGNKEFHGPILQGGPTIIVANHPKTGKRMYIEANLPAGSPVIAYHPLCITYAYQERRVVIEFCPLSDETAAVKMLPGYGVARKSRDAARRNAAARQSGRVAHGPLVESVGEFGRTAKTVVVGTAGAASHIAGSTIDGGRRVIEAVPPFVQLKSAGDQHRTNQAANSILDRPTIR